MKDCCQYILIISLILFSNTGYSQNTFQKVFGGPNDDVFVDFEKTDDNGLLLLGHTSSFGMGMNDIVLAKLNAEGELEWSKLYGNSGNDTGHDLKKTSNGDYIICGSTESSGAGESDIYILRVDNVGNLLWSKTYGGPNWEQPRGKAIEMANGDFVVISTTLSFGAGAKDILFLRINSMGELLISKTYGGSDNDWVHDFVQMNNGDIIMGGRINHTSSGSYGSLIRIDETGYVIWSKSYNNSGFCKFYRLTKTENENIIGVGRMDSYGAGDADLFVAMTNPDGNLLWAKTYGGPSYELANGVEIASDQKIVFSGYTSSFGFGAKDIFLIKIDYAGNFIWGKTYGGPEDDFIFSGSDLLNFENSNYYINGKTNSFGIGNLNMYLIKTDITGNSGCNEMDFIPTITTPPNMENTIDIFTGTGGVEGNPNTIVNNVDLPLTVLCPLDLPVALFYSEDTTICINECINFIDTSLFNPNSWNWFFEGGTPSTSNNQNPTNICYSNAGQFDVKLTVSNQSGSDSIILFNYITVNPSPDINLGNDTLICTGYNLILDAGSGYLSYLWNTGSTDTTITVDTTGIYWVEVYNEFECSSIDSIFVEVAETPVIDLGNDTSLCLNDFYLLDPGQGYSEYLWQDGSTNPTFPANISGLYWVEVTNEFGCTTTDSINVELFPSPDIDLGNDTLICIGSSLTLDAGSGYQSYLWNTGSLDSTITIDTTGIYWVGVTNEFGCIAIDSIYVGLAPNAIEDLDIGNDTVFCYGQEVILNAGPGYTSYEWQDGSTDSLFIADTTGVYYVHVSNPCGEAWDTIQLSLFPITKIDLGNDSSVCLSDGFVLLDPGTGFNSYQWQDGSNNQFYFANQSGEYWVEIIDDNGCAVCDTISLDFIDPDPGLGPDTTICAGNIITFSALEGFAAYLWQDGSDGYSIVTGTEGTYWCEVTDSLGCTGADSVLLGLLYPPNISLGNDTSICLGDSIFLSYFPVDSNFTYLWQDGTSDSVKVVDSEAYYWVQATNMCGSGFDSIYVSLLPLPSVFLGGDMVIGIRDEVVLDAGEGFESYLWYDGSTYQTITVSDSGNYWVRVSDGSCFNSDTVHIEEVSCDLLVPIVFTPNWDNFNDYFQVVASDDIIGFDLVVVNRWGEKMWETNDVNGKWDGRKNDANSPTGTYFWICEYNCLLSHKTYVLKGSVTLLR